MNISNIRFDNNVFLAPMAGVTDIIFRSICKQMGCGLTYTEMVSAKALYYGSEKTEELFQISEQEGKAAVQIFGSEPLVMAKSCEYFNKNDKISIIDINMGCPAPKIVKNGEGSALMKNPKLAYSIVKEVKKATFKPVTVKFRKGFNEDNINAVDFAKTMEEAGADAITVHGRTAAQMYTGTADLDIIKKVKESVNIPVTGNGDIFSPEDAIKMINYTNCDAVMVARGAMGNPWIFSEILDKINKREVKYPSDVERIDMCIKHYKMALNHYDENRVVREMRKQIAWYIKGLKNCTEIKCSINIENNSSEVIKKLEEYRESFT
ncbi:tRNA dihydrouridine synthase DusB [Clostridium hydrogenum]|uniref:tRNA dihydrouridine synthase DusB n=1 Tax=Clostridium hydrogenum TaxID=2855764 RepID=UPI001F1C9700|nr:tRNA dihydrouridine synthase DusB [Clostridium hydrogenum]